MDETEVVFGLDMLVALLQIWRPHGTYIVEGRGVRGWVVLQEVARHRAVFDVSASFPSDRERASIRTGCQ